MAASWSQQSPPSDLDGNFPKAAAYKLKQPEDGTVHLQLCVAVRDANDRGLHRMCPNYSLASRRERSVDILLICQQK
jgi:hypothetical protein